MPLKIYGFKLSSCTRRVAVICKELQVPYELIQVDLSKGEQHSPAHLARQPFGLVPTIEVPVQRLVNDLQVLTTGHLI